MRRRRSESGASGPAVQGRRTLSLAGAWRLRLDPDDEGLSANWADAPLETSKVIALPGTTDLAGFGFPLDAKSMRHRAVYPPTTLFPGVPEPTHADSRGHLARRSWFVGPRGDAGNRGDPWQGFTPGADSRAPERFSATGWLETLCAFAKRADVPTSPR